MSLIFEKFQASLIIYFSMGYLVLIGAVYISDQIYFSRYCHLLFKNRPQRLRSRTIDRRGWSTCAAGWLQYLLFAACPRPEMTKPVL